MIVIIAWGLIIMFELVSISMRLGDIRSLLRKQLQHMEREQTQDA